MLVFSFCGSAAALVCTNQALNKVVSTTTRHAFNTSRLQTNGRPYFNCLPDHKMAYPEIMIDFEEQTEVSFLHIFLKRNVSACE